METKKWTKWKNPSTKVDVKDVVLILDHLNKETSFPALGTIEEKVSERTFKVSYVKKPASLNNRQEITSKAVLGTLIRPAQSLCLLLSPGKNNVASNSSNLDTFELIGQDLPKVNPPTKNQITYVFDDQSEVIRDTFNK